MAGVLVLWGAGVARLFYWSGSGEHDTFMMAAAVVKGAHTGEVLNPFCYGKEVQFLFYYLARALTQIWTPASQDVLLAMNITGSAAALVIPFLLVIVLGRLFADGTRARLAVLLVVTSPLYFYTLSYGHPFHIALALFLVSSILVQEAGSQPASAPWWLLLSLATLLQGVALMIRFEQVLLFGVLLLGYQAADWKRRSFLALSSSLSFAGAVGLFLAAKRLLVSSSPAETERAARSLLEYASIAWNLLNPGDLTWGTTRMLVEVGPPLLVGGGLLAFVCVLRRRWPSLMALSAGVAPSLAVYLANPSPPRHFFVLGVGLACFIATNVQTARLCSLRMLTALVLASNLVAPWALIVADGRTLPDRAVAAYNVVERSDRNRSQIREAFPFYDRLVAAADGRPVVVFGSWVHLAQLASALVSDPDLEMQKVRLLPNLTAISLRRAGLQLYFVETYDPHFVVAAITTLQRNGGAPLFLSLLEAGPSINDLGVTIPAPVLWWTS